jgi:HEAT repeat protein
MEQVRARLDPDEPEYSKAAAELGPDAIPHLAKLVEGGDPMLASKATYLASLIPSDKSVDVIESAARSPHDEVRVAAASGVRNMKKVPTPLLETLFKDKDAGVRKVALRSIETNEQANAKPILEKVAKDDPNPNLRKLAGDIVKNIK